MALTPQDREFYEKKLGWMGFLYLFIATVVMGAIVWPLLAYFQFWSAGQTGKWSSGLTEGLALNGMVLGSAMSVVMFLIARLYLWMGWLPRRR